MLRDPNSNVFASVDANQFREVRRIIIDAIMGTEMSGHVTMVDQLNDIEDADTAFLDKPGRQLLVKSLVHSADLSGQAL